MPNLYQEEISGAPLAAEYPTNLDDDRIDGEAPDSLQPDRIDAPIIERGREPDPAPNLGPDQFDETFYRSTRVWRFPGTLIGDSYSARPVDDEDSDNGSDNDHQGDLDDDDDYSDEERLSDDGIESMAWQNGLSALDVLDEEFEQEASRRGGY
jgi:hypothetical protein